MISENAEWFFFSGGAGAPRYGDDPTKHAVDHNTETFVREVIQNANDQRVRGEKVTITFRFLSLKGNERDRFLRAIEWDQELEPRFKAIATRGRSERFERVVSRMSDPEAELRLLVVEDCGATGMTGNWDEDSNFAALVRDELYSKKQSATAGGSYGLGKSVLWTFSAASTVIFNSHTIDTGNGHRNPRLIGRTKLPTHELEDGTTYQGAGWLCRLTGDGSNRRPCSLWGENAELLANRLHVDRPPQSGTSALIVGYEDPTRDEQPDLNELGDEFLGAAVKYFWPAIHRGDLEVVVSTPEETRSANLSEDQKIRPFVDCFERRNSDLTELDHPGDVAGLDIPFELPPRTDGTDIPDGAVRLGVRLASPTDDDTLVNRLALFRGSGMVVKYLDQNRIAFGDRNFHGVLACGDARSDLDSTESDAEIDRFLRFAEPPAHDEWESTENLRDRYRRGYRTALESMFDTTRNGLRHLLAEASLEDRGLADRVLQRFPIHGSGPTRRPRASPEQAFEIESSSFYDGNCWSFEGRIKPLVETVEGWSAEISLTGLGEDGSTYESIPIEKVRTNGSDVNVARETGRARFVVVGNDSAIEFEGRSHPMESGEMISGEVGETRLEIVAELREGGDAS